MLGMIHYKKFPFTELQGNHCVQRSRPAIPVMNQRNLPSHFINMDFCITLKTVRGSMVSAITRIYVGRSGVQILDRTRELSFLQNIQTSYSTHAASNSMKTRTFSLAVKWPRETDHSHAYWDNFKNQGSYTSTQPVCLYGTYWDKFIVPRPPTYVHITHLSSSVISHVLISVNLSVLK